MGLKFIYKSFQIGLSFNSPSIKAATETECEAPMQQAFPDLEMDAVFQQNSIELEMNPIIHQTIPESEAQLREDRLFVELRNYMVDDLIKQGFEQSYDDDEYDDYSDDSYYVMFVHEDVILYLLRAEEGHSMVVSASSFKWEDFVVSTKEEWDVYSPRIAIPLPDWCD